MIYIVCEKSDYDFFLELFFDMRFAIFDATAPAPIPLSMLTTDSPNEQL